MASGRKHSQVSNILSCITFPLFLYDVNLVGISIGCHFGVFLSPDLDVDAGFIGFTKANKITRVAFFERWAKPYSMAYKHRSFITHFPLISTVWRLFYFLCPLIVLFFKNQPTSRLKIVKNLFFPILFSGVLNFGIWYFYFLLEARLEFLLYTFLGLVISDFFHFLYDFVF